MLALFPAISMLVSIYGLVFDPDAVESQLHLLDDLLPGPAYSLIEGRVHELLGHPTGSLSVSLVVSTLLTFWSSSTGSKSLLSAVNVAYDVQEQRSLLHFQAVGLAMTFGGLLGAAVTLSVLVGLKPLLSLFAIPGDTAGMVHGLSLLLLLLAFAAAVAWLFRFGPSKRADGRRYVFPGTAVAAGGWVMASVGLSLYVDHIASFGATYGSLGAVVGIMLWLYVSAYAILFGAELNARLEADHAGN